MHVLIQVSGKKEDPKGIEPLGILYGNLLRPARLPTRKRRSTVSNPIRTSDDLQNKQFTAMKCLILRVRVGSRHTGHQAREKEKAPLFVVLSRAW